jgi:hypothetical protein
MPQASPICRWAAAVWRHTAPTNAVRVLMLSVVFGSVIALGAHRVWQPAAVQASAPAVAVSADPVVRFTETRVGHLLFAPVGSDNCRRVLFDNKTGALYEAGEMLCGQPQEQVANTATTSNRLQALRQTFQK